MIDALNVFYDARTEKSKNSSNRKRIVLYSEEIKRSMFTRVLRLRQWHFQLILPRDSIHVCKPSVSGAFETKLTPNSRARQKTN